MVNWTLINCLYYISGPRQSSSLTAPSLASAGLLNVCYYMPAWKNRAAEERRKILLSEVCEADVRANFSCTVPNKMSLCLKTFPLRSCRVCSFLVYTDQGLTLLHLHADMAEDLLKRIALLSCKSLLDFCLYRCSWSFKLLITNGIKWCRCVCVWPWRDAIRSWERGQVDVCARDVLVIMLGRERISVLNK